MRKQSGKMSIYRSGRRRLSTRALLSIMVPAILVMIAGVSFVTPKIFSSHAANGDNQPPPPQQMVNCTLTVPANPLTAKGLATPYQLGGGCDEANMMQAAFVQGAVIDPAGNISVYNPLVVNRGQQPAAAPVMPNIPAGSTVGIWFGFNGNNLTLRSMNGSLRQGKCVNGTNNSLFGEFAYCNAPAFFQAANAAMAAGKINPNPAVLGTGKDGLPCPTVRDFGVVDQDQSDNVTTTYAINGAQQVNASDNRLVAVLLDGALGCTPLMAPDLANPGQMATALPLNELQAAARQAAPAALVPKGDPMTLVNANPNTRKTNLYRVGVDQPAVGASDGGNTTTYCQNLRNIAPQRLVTDALLTGAANSPVPAAANTLFTFMAQRFQITFEGPLGTGLQCTAPNRGPVQVQKNGNAVAISATITVNGQAQCFDSMGNKVAMTVCMNNANTGNNTNNNKGNGDGNYNGNGNGNGNGNNNNNANGMNNANNNNADGNGMNNANNNANGGNNANNNADGNGMNNANNNNANGGNNANNNANGNGNGNGNNNNANNNNTDNNNANGMQNANNNNANGGNNANGNGNGMQNANNNNANGNNANGNNNNANDNNANGMQNANNNANGNGGNNANDNGGNGGNNANDNGGNSMQNANSNAGNGGNQ